MEKPNKDWDCEVEVHESPIQFIVSHFTILIPHVVFCPGSSFLPHPHPLSAPVYFLFPTRSVATIWHHIGACDEYVRLYVCIYSILLCVHVSEHENVCVCVCRGVVCM